MPEEQTPFISRPLGPPALDDAESPVVTLSRHRYNVLLQCERTIRKLGIQDDPDAKATEVVDRVSTATDILNLLIGVDTVEPKGILSRIEHHIVRAFGMLDELTVDGDAHTAGLNDLRTEVRGDYEAVLKELQSFEKKLSYVEVDAPSLAGRLEKISTEISTLTHSFVDRFVRLERDTKDVRDVLAVHVEQRLSNIERAIVNMIARS